MKKLVDIEGNRQSNWGGIAMGFASRAEKQRLIDAAARQVEQIAEEPEATSVNYTRFVELDIPTTGSTATLLVCAAYTTGSKFNASIFHSHSSDGSYTNIGSLRYFCSRGVLTADYPGDIPLYDKDFGIYYEATHGDDDFISISKGDLFSAVPDVVLVVNNEIMRFGTVTPVGETGFRLTDVVRGQFFTNRGDHKVGDEVFVVHLAGSTISVEDSGMNYFKIIPVSMTGERTLESDCSPIPLMVTHKHATPLMPAIVTATRVDAQVTVAWVPRSKGLAGAGRLSADISVDVWPPVVPGDFLVEINGVFNGVTTIPTITLKKKGTFVVDIAHRDCGRLSQRHTLTIGAEDGIYRSIAQD